VIVDEELGPSPGPAVSYVLNDEAVGTTLAAQRIAHILAGHGAIALIGINPRSEGALSREEDLKALAPAAPNVRLTDRRFGDSVITHQQQIAQEIMEQADRVNAIVALTSAATRGAYYAKVANEPRPDVLIVGFVQDILFPIETGDVGSVVDQNTREIGRVAMRNLQAEMHGEKIDGVTLVSAILLTRDNELPRSQTTLGISALQLARTVSRSAEQHQRSKLSVIAGFAALLLVGTGLSFHLRTKPFLASTPLPSDLSRQDAWIALGGTWTASAHEVENTSKERGAKLITRLGSWQAYQVQADIQIAEPSSEAGLILRSNEEEEGVDAYHGYFSGIRTMDSSLEFGRADFGWHPLVRISLPQPVDLQRRVHLRVLQSVVPSAS
jgi:hypothetical protein